MRPCATSLAALLLAGAAGAHPVDEVVQSAYLTLAPGEVRLEIDLVAGAEVAGAVLSDLDPDADGAVDVAEARAFAEGVLALSRLTLDGEPAAWTLGEVAAPNPAVLLTGFGVLRILAVAARPEGGGERRLAYEAGYAPAESLWMANVFLRPEGGPALRVTGQDRSDDGRRLEVGYAEGDEG